MEHQYKRVDTPQTSAFPVAGASYPFLYAAAFATLVFALLELAVMAGVGLVVTFCIAFFFRDPERFVPESEGAVVSPADGRVIRIQKMDENPFLENECLKISIFMSVFNVHVNRVPCSGSIADTTYRPGKFFSANRQAASMENEHQAIILESENQGKICFVQVAGLVARRIICRVQAGDRVTRGERFGMICFGSRLDVYLPSDMQPAVSVGDKVKAGQSVLGFFA